MRDEVDIILARRAPDDAAYRGWDGVILPVAVAREREVMRYMKLWTERDTSVGMSRSRNGSGYASAFHVAHTFMRLIKSEFRYLETMPPPVTYDEFARLVRTHADVKDDIVAARRMTSGNPSPDAYNLSRMRDWGHTAVDFGVGGAGLYLAQSALAIPAAASAAAAGVAAAVLVPSISITDERKVWCATLTFVTACNFTAVRGDGTIFRSVAEAFAFELCLRRVLAVLFAARYIWDPVSTSVGDDERMQWLGLVEAALKPRPWRGTVTLQRGNFLRRMFEGTDVLAGLPARYAGQTMSMVQDVRRVPSLSETYEIVLEPPMMMVSPSPVPSEFLLG